MEIKDGRRIRVRDGRKTEIQPEKNHWGSKQTSAYMRSCASCPIEKYCTFLIPSAYYYVSGVIKIRGLRDKPTNKFLPFFNSPA